MRHYYIIFIPFGIIALFLLSFLVLGVQVTMNMVIPFLSSFLPGLALFCFVFLAPIISAYKLCDILARFKKLTFLKCLLVVGSSFAFTILSMNVINLIYPNLFY